VRFRRREFRKSARRDLDLVGDDRRGNAVGSMLVGGPVAVIRQRLIVFAAVWSASCTSFKMTSNG